MTDMEVITAWDMMSPEERRETLINAERWNALLEGGRVRMIGSANVDHRGEEPPREGEWIHFGAEFWSEYPGVDQSEFDRVDRVARTWFKQAVTTLADRIRGSKA
ncbi:hypothetical protein vBCbaSRXM_31 [Citromicrobium phage vB_CbaS-RXM]|nr:hypothetical protein vBCbaSRXM_31 [Citromicrobium phage vB_CbaS-RXM]